MTPATWSGVEPGIPDGLKVDSIGRVYLHRPGRVVPRAHARAVESAKIRKPLMRRGIFRHNAGQFEPETSL